MDGKSVREWKVERSLYQALHMALAEEMKRDKSVCIMGKQRKKSRNKLSSLTLCRSLLLIGNACLHASLTRLRGLQGSVEVWGADVYDH